MNKLIVLTLCMCAGCAQHAAIWTGIDTDTEPDEAVGVLRVGYLPNGNDADEPKIEVGIASNWFLEAQGSKKDIHQMFGVFGVLHKKEPIMIPDPFQGFAEQVEAYPYAGGKVTVDFSEGGSMAGPLAGVQIYKFIFLEGGWAAVGQDLEAGMNDRFYGRIGARFQF